MSDRARRMMDNLRAQPDDGAAARPDVDRAAEGFAEDLRRAAAAAPVREPFHDFTEYAPRSNRIEGILMEGGEGIKTKCFEVIDEVTATVNKTLDDLEREISQLRQTTKNSADAAKLSLENQLAIASRSLQSANSIRETVKEFRAQVEQSLPTNGNGNPTREPESET